MPEVRTFRGQEVKVARRIFLKGKPMIKIIYHGSTGQPGPQIIVTPEEYEAEVQRKFRPGTSVAGNR